MKIRQGACCLGILLLLGTGAMADITVSIDGSAPWLGYMNVSNLPANGGAFQFGSGWGIPDLTASFADSILTLGPNTINDPAPYWYTPAGGPGAAGNKTMDANLYVETTGVFVAENLTFTGVVLENTLVSPYTSVAFIKDFAPDYSSFTMVTAPLVEGTFSITLLTSSDPGRHIQYGFETIGPNVWITDVADKGVVRLAPIPEPSSAVLAMVGILGLVRKRRAARISADLAVKS
ncbi:MAG: PEP-CTERM sorting domain-containing protein [Verrucomicrobiota bacterium]